MIPDRNLDRLNSINREKGDRFNVRLGRIRPYPPTRVLVREGPKTSKTAIFGFLGVLGGGGVLLSIR